MSIPRVREARAALPLLLAISAIVAVAALVLTDMRPASNGPPRAGATPVAVIAPPGDPIAAEADVFRTGATVLAIDPAPGGRRAAHPRSLATWRSLRAYPGAPPRIPHGLTPDETLRGGCNTCHERGGFSQRFGAYVPITPHPEKGACAQCHVGDVKLMSTPLPGLDPSARCRQCHAPGAMRWRDSSMTFHPLAWPELATDGGEHGPQPIPHGRERTNCLACHSAPAAVREIRTSHPERANCRQCHVEAGSAAEFRRPDAGSGRRGGQL